MSGIKKYLFTIMISLSVLAVLFVLAWGKINFKLSASDFIHISDRPIFLVSVIYVAILFLYGLRFKCLSQLSLGSSVSVVAIGNGLNCLLPFRLGEVGRMYYAKRFFHIPLSSMVLLTFLERYIDLIALLLIASGVFFSQYGSHLNHMSFGIVILALLASASLLIFLSRKEFFQKMLKNYLGENAFCAIAEIVKRLKSPLFSGKIALITLSIWALTLFSYAMFFYCLNPPQAIGISGAAFLLVITTLSMLVPSLVANIGVFESVVVVFLVKYIHIEINESLAIAAMLHLANVLPQLLTMGACMLWSFKKARMNAG